MLIRQYLSHINVICDYFYFFKVIYLVWFGLFFGGFFCVFLFSFSWSGLGGLYRENPQKSRGINT